MNIMNFLKFISKAVKKSLQDLEKYKEDGKKEHK